MDGFLLKQCSEVVIMIFKRGREARLERLAEIFSGIKIIDTAIQVRYQTGIEMWARERGQGLVVLFSPVCGGSD